MKVALAGRQGGTAAQRRFDQRLRPHALLPGCPEAVAAIGLQPLDSGFAALAALHHAVDGLQAMEIVAAHAAVADGDRFVRGGAQGELHRGDSPGDRQA